MKKTKNDEFKAADDIINKITGAFQIGKAYYVRLITYHLIGRVVDIKDDFVFLEDAVWIADSGRFSDFWQGKSKPAEYQYIGDYFFNTKAVVDGGVWKNDINF